VKSRGHGRDSKQNTKKHEVDVSCCGELSLLAKVPPHLAEPSHLAEGDLQLRTYHPQEVRLATKGMIVTTTTMTTTTTIPLH